MEPLCLVACQVMGYKLFQKLASESDYFRFGGTKKVVRIFGVLHHSPLLMPHAEHVQVNVTVRCQPHWCPPLNNL